MKKAVIFDLDGTVIDSSHRANFLPDGSLNLADWIENNKPAKILEDSELPLANLWRGLIAGGMTIAICTARFMQDADHLWLRERGLFANVIFSRPLGCRDADHDLKREQLSAWINAEGFERVTMYDDNKNVRETISQLGVVCIDPIGYNNSLV